MKTSPGVTWAFGVKLGFCDNIECDAIHFDLVDKTGRVFATAPINKDVAALFADELQKFARGEKSQ